MTASTSITPPASPRAFAGVPATWAALVLVLTLTPAQEMPDTPHWDLLSFDTAAHAGVFAVLSFTSYISARRQRRFPTLRRQALLWVGVGCTLFGGLIEVLQATMGLGRQGEWSDLISDTLGTVAGLGAAWLLRRWWQA
ncbi:VanZ family protein [Hymenobacter profundi]|uniref:VanZ family protein n=1 Tax=Hymenobacter profundi TaxID=1982110 RepID=A0ABS6WUT4_9BACT|nr:VanZ family protein [Hymenobacter profundi]MBW3127338.1 VanZ family protein [Hymenobacter profundi]